LSDNRIAVVNKNCFACSGLKVLQFSQRITKAFWAASSALSTFLNLNNKKFLKNLKLASKIDLKTASEHKSDMSTSCFKCVDFIK
jgi:hypothetical protein